MKIVTLTKEEFDKFSIAHPLHTYYQTSMYGNLMKGFGFNTHYLGFTDDENKLVGATLIIYKKFFMNHKYAYAPRGFLIDYSNKETLQQLITALKKLLFKQEFSFLKLDPPIYCSERDKKGNVMAYNKDVNNIIDNLKQCGFNHLGFNNFFEGIKPRWNAFVKLNTRSQYIFLKFDKQVRNKVRKASKIGINIYQDPNGNVKPLFEFIKKKYNRSLDYYLDFQKQFSNKGMFEVYYARIMPEQYIISSQKSYDQEQIKNDKLANVIQNHTTLGVDMNRLINQKLESDKLLNNYKRDLIEATNLLKTDPQGILVGGAIVIKYANYIELLIEGFNTKYRSLNSNYLLKWYLIDKYSKLGYKYLNLGGITGDFEKTSKYKGLNEMKLGFNATANEYIGEFDFIINKAIYGLYKASKKITDPVKKDLK